MKVSLLTVIVVGVLPGQVVAQQPAYLQQTSQTTRVRQVQQQVPSAPQHAANSRVEPEYRFNLAISITATGYHKGKKRENSVMTYYINPAEGWVATQSGCEQKVATPDDCPGLEIFDVNGGTMLVVNTHKKSGMSLPMPKVAETHAKYRRDLNIPPPGENGCRCEASGKKKMIQGFRAEEYKCVKPSSKASFVMWVTRDLKTDLAAPGARTELSGFMHRAARFQAVPLEGYYFEDGKLTSSLMLTSVNRSVHLSVKTAEYKLNSRH